MKLFEINEQSPLDWTMDNLKLMGDFGDKKGYGRKEVDTNATFYSAGKFKGGADLSDFWVEPKKVITSPPYYITKCVGWVGKWKIVKNSDMKILNPTEVYVWDFDGTVDEIKLYLSKFKAENVYLQFKAGFTKELFNVLMAAKGAATNGYEIESGPLSIYYYPHNDKISVMIDGVVKATVDDEFELQDWLVNNGYDNLL
ncbi:hypothetical protein RsoM2USA_325 [Ralstonia phage RsoM2USA]|nr:hypothetical protein RsoM2USA_325 [Ralstonia phage RsoM2USA]